MVFMGQNRRAALSAARHRVARSVCAATCAAALLGAGVAEVAQGAAVPRSVAPQAAAPRGQAADPDTEKRRIDAEIAKLREQLDETNGDLTDAYVALRTTQAKLPGAEAALASAQAAAFAAEQANEAAEQALAVAKVNEAKSEDELEATVAEIAASRTKVAQFAAQIYQEQGFGQLDMALSSTSPQEFAERLALVDTVMDVQGQTVERLATQQATQAALEDHLSALRAESARKQQQARATLDRATAARDEAAQAKAALDTLAADQASQAAAVNERLTGEKQRLATAQAESKRLQAVLAEIARKAREEAARLAKKKGNGQAVPPTTTTRTGFLSAPVRVGYVSSEFGSRFHPILNYWRLHAGRDYAASCGTPVYAAAPGTIVSAGAAGGSGNRIVVSHGLVNGIGLASTYNHLSSFRRTSGQVSRGTLIGYVGTTGLSTGCHLHFEVYENGAPVDPRKYL